MAKARPSPALSYEQRSDPDALTHRERQFVAAFAEECNATEAARRAGYSEKNAKHQGAALLRRPRVVAAVDRALDQKARRHQINADRILSEVVAMALFDPRRLYGPDGKILPPHEWPDDAAAGVAGFKVTRTAAGETIQVKQDKLAALDKLMRYLGLLTPALQVNHHHEGQVDHRLVIEDMRAELLYEIEKHAALIEDKSGANGSTEPEPTRADC